MIPFEQQLELHSCGAAALVMIYRSFGWNADQRTVLQETGYSRRITQLAAHARNKGLQTMIVRFNDSWKGLCAVHQKNMDCRIIINHRLLNNVHFGHYSVIVHLLHREQEMIVHDPLFGPNRHWKRETLYHLWNEPGGEIAGKIALLIKMPDSKIYDTKYVKCTECKNFVDLNDIQEILPYCEQIFCPNCDHPMSVKNERMQLYRK
ncbi:MAG: hypothetical protein LBQ50_01215 [Planctomycetaceae bacterium]|jgi:ABC-type bacteriocin/lantibiotic exporter with double-glycine peptidase domain|nr:hypothetical protein [Planctomycetaceae bacterium]